MKESIDYILSLIFGGMAFTMLINFQIGVGNTASEQIFESAVQGDLNTATSILAYDFQKIGYGSTDSVKVTQADTSTISFKSDIDANGTVETVKYYLGETVPGSMNPNSRMLYRQINGGTPNVIAGGVSKFRLSYYNSAGSPTSVLSQVRSVYVALTVESNYGTDSTYPAVCWERTIKPRNLR
jgi:hypothetical protein